MSAAWQPDTDEHAFERIVELERKRTGGPDFPAGLVAYGELEDGSPVFTVTHRRARTLYWLMTPEEPWASVVLRAPAGSDPELPRLLTDAAVQARLISGVMRQAFEQPWPRWPLVDVKWDNAGRPTLIADGAMLRVHPLSPEGETVVVEWDAYALRLIDEDGVIEEGPRDPD